MRNEHNKFIYLKELSAFCFRNQYENLNLFSDERKIISSFRADRQINLSKLNFAWDIYVTGKIKL